MKDLARRPVVDLGDLAHFGVSQDLAPRRMDQNQTIRTAQRPASFELLDPCPLVRGDRTPNRQSQCDRVIPVFDDWRLEHLGQHGVLHHVDPSPGILGQAIAAECRDHRKVPGGEREGPASAEPGALERIWSQFAKLGPYEGNVLDVEGRGPAEVAARIDRLLADGSLLV